MNLTRFAVQISDVSGSRRPHFTIAETTRITRHRGSRVSPTFGTLACARQALAWRRLRQRARRAMGDDMPNLDRRRFLKLAAALGASLAVGCTPIRESSSGWRERRDLYPQGVASGDPDENSVLLWTRRPYADGRQNARLLVEVAEDPAFTRVVAKTNARILAQSDWTCRVLVADLRPAGEYWYRFVDEDGNGSRIGAR